MPISHHSPESSTKQTRYHDDLEMEDAIHTELLTLGKDMDETNIEVGIIKDKKFHFLTPEGERLLGTGRMSDKSRPDSRARA
ncbi:hypothetical protein PsorP6_005008 [Peronosclerospora sorghi]|uniref:Uncharacterized protein n=1 Tax=Peronosclerospora sorghi TaxID=230839 RepID=A0ACC0W391_9STRA|nr:hypothetical protein PsorP6_005008 [Peronosclerospora sorghi]